MTTENSLPGTSRLLAEGMEKRWHIGAQIYVSRDGRVIANAAMGLARPGVPMTIETLMPWLSAGKPLTSAAIALLVEDGRADWDDAVSRFIPEFARNGKDPVTLRHLLTHTGGFRSADKVSMDLSWAETIRAICEAPLEAGWVPGEKAGYHTASSWFILGGIIQRVSGSSFSEFIRGSIFEPLSMKDCWIGMPPAEIERYEDRLGVMHTMTGGEPVPNPVWEPAVAYRMPRPGGNACGPIRELGRFYEAMLAARAGSARLMAAETARLLASRQRAGMFDHTFQHVMDWGLGFMSNSNRHGMETVPYSFGRLASEEAFGHGGAQSVSAFADPERGVVVAWVLNGMPGERIHNRRAREINTAIYDDLGLGQNRINAPQPAA